jgi:histidinol-phosphatase (PHP family)
MNEIIPSQLISLHGGHSGQFCCHARDSLEQIIQAYVENGFKRVGISEHMPPPGDDQRYPDEIEKGFSAADLLDRFTRYFEELDRLKEKYQEQIRIFRAFETETFTGWEAQTAALMEKFKPDYVVGSLHHVQDVCFDYSPQARKGLVQALGSEQALYLAYLDTQYEMLRRLQPFVVGHFDIIRIHDPDYESRFRIPEIWEKVDRNLALIKDLGLCMDYNLRPLSRGEAHAYPCPDILNRARQLGIPMVPGDDAHGRHQAGAHVARAVRDLAALGFSTNWPAPFCRPFYHTKEAHP